MQLGDIYLGLGDTSEVRHWYERALALNPESPYPYRQLALVSLLVGDCQGAADYIDETLARSSNIAIQHILD